MAQVADSKGLFASNETTISVPFTIGVSSMNSTSRVGASMEGGRRVEYSHTIACWVNG